MAVRPQDLNTKFQHWARLVPALTCSTLRTPLAFRRLVSRVWHGLDTLRQLQCVGCGGQIYWPFSGTLVALCGPVWPLLGVLVSFW